MNPLLTDIPNAAETAADRGPRPRSDADQLGRRIQELLSRVDQLPNGPARELTRDCLQSLLALYGDGLARILQLVRNAGATGEPIRAAIVQDKLVRGLLLIHGLHPVALETRLREALDTIRPYLQSHGGNVELIGLHNDVARLRLQGTCKSCPSSSVTLELAVRRVIEDACPDLAGFEVEGVHPQPAGPAPGPCLVEP